jgi:hypothetical protein
MSRVFFGGLGLTDRAFFGVLGVGLIGWGVLMVLDGPPVVGEGRLAELVAPNISARVGAASRMLVRIDIPIGIRLLCEFLVMRTWLAVISERRRVAYLLG